MSKSECLVFSFIDPTRRKFDVLLDSSLTIGEVKKKIEAKIDDYDYSKFSIALGEIQFDDETTLETAEKWRNEYGFIGYNYRIEITDNSTNISPFYFIFGENDKRKINIRMDDKINKIKMYLNQNNYPHCNDYDSISLFYNSNTELDGNIPIKFVGIAKDDSIIVKSVPCAYNVLMPDGTIRIFIMRKRDKVLQLKKLIQQAYEKELKLNQIVLKVDDNELQDNSDLYYERLQNDQIIVVYLKTENKPVIPTPQRTFSTNENVIVPKLRHRIASSSTPDPSHVRNSKFRHSVQLFSPKSGKKNKNGLPDFGNSDHSDDPDQSKKSTPKSKEKSKGKHKIFSLFSKKESVSSLPKSKPEHMPISPLTPIKKISYFILPEKLVETQEQCDFIKNLKNGIISQHYIQRKFSKNNCSASCSTENTKVNILMVVAFQIHTQTVSQELPYNCSVETAKNELLSFFPSTIMMNSSMLTIKEMTSNENNEKEWKLLVNTDIIHPTYLNIKHPIYLVELNIQFCFDIKDYKKQIQKNFKFYPQQVNEVYKEIHDDIMNLSSNINSFKLEYNKEILFSDSQFKVPLNETISVIIYEEKSTKITLYFKEQTNKIFEKKFEKDSTIKDISREISKESNLKVPVTLIYQGRILDPKSSITDYHIKKTSSSSPIFIYRRNPLKIILKSLENNA